ncbi:MAG: hypothetical protein WC755_07665 [Candidatus Woesearchaeota archaeon]
MIIECPNCDEEFIAYEWENITCPKCGRTAYWDSYFSYGTDGEIEDEFAFVDWEEIK